MRKTLAVVGSIALLTSCTSYYPVRQDELTRILHVVDDQGRLQVVDRRSGKTQPLYFNVAIPFGSFERSMRQDTTARKP